MSSMDPRPPTILNFLLKIHLAVFTRNGLLVPGNCENAGFCTIYLRPPAIRPSRRGQGKGRFPTLRAQHLKSVLFVLYENELCNSKERIISICRRARIPNPRKRIGFRTGQLYKHTGYSNIPRNPT